MNASKTANEATSVDGLTIEPPRDLASDRGAPGRDDGPGAWGKVAVGIVLALPAAATLYFSFNGGGFFAGSTALAAAVLALVLLLRITVAAEPFAGVSRSLVLAAGAFALYAAWTLASASWSHAPARALLEFDRALLYLLALVVFGTFAQTPQRLAWAVRGVGAALFAVCAVALVTRTLPDVWPIAPNIVNARLSYPLTYWNALGLMAALAIVICLHLAASRHEPRSVRILASSAVPVAAATLFFTFSRGAITAGACGLVAYLVLARPGALGRALVATVPPTVVAVVVAYQADLLSTDHPASAAGMQQGHRVALVTALCAAVAGVVRWGLSLAAEDGPPRAWPVWLSRRRTLPVIATASVCAAVVVAFPLDAPGFVDRQFHRFVDRQRPGDVRGDFRSRLSDPSNNGRLDHWRVALNGSRASPVHGSGAGTYRLLWARGRPRALTVNNAHSLYVETLGELGVVGLALLVVAIATLLGGLALRAWRSRSAAHAALFAAALAWTLHAGVDWDWQMPAVTFWLFAVGGLALAEPRRAAGAQWRLGRLTRLLAGLGCLVLAIVPVRVGLSQAYLNRSAHAFDRGDCTAAIDAALASNAALSARPEPYEILGFCDARLGYGGLAVRALNRAIERDPGNWEYRYGLAVARGAAGLDPRASARRALALNPLGALPRAAVLRFRSGGPRAWARAARSLPLPGKEL